LHYVTSDSKLISFEQLDVKYNRPDLVLKTFENSDTNLINAYRNAYNKRIKKLGIDPSAFREGYSVPDADFAKRNAINPAQKNEQLTLHIRASDKTYNLDRYNIWLNEVPVYGQRGINIRKNKTKVLDKTVIVKLSAGENRIEVSVTNVNGAESYRKPLIVNYTPQTVVEPKIYFAGIGINNFKDSTNNLRWCVQDIRDLVIMMKEKYGNQLVILDTLFNEEVTPAAVKKIKQKLQQTAINDKVIISYSGHGLLSKNFDYYLSSYNVNFSKPESGGILYEEFEELLDSIPARRKILFLDACHSGELDKDELQKINATEKSLAMNNVKVNSGNRGGVVTVEERPSSVIGLKNSFELMQSLFVNVGKGTGATVISASGGVQFAQERSDLGHGVFTYSLIEVMKKYSTIKVSDLKKYIGQRVTELTNGLQVPTSRSELVSVDWNVW
jgi:hypothetical protein